MLLMLSRCAVRLNVASTAVAGCKHRAEATHDSICGKSAAEALMIGLNISIGTLAFMPA